ncbi:uncharacterized protein DDB_G0283357-like [Trichogramma pretiosum]|uniref:uncharacterized protein DDB_G0283357-like n=1 Tax=Trichogramma pretiosum TaxID=7493 RepID=UPI000C71C940|nr:uncharacterized protein DDB_G0283357-like [Trichogramma pretiosum]
MKCPQRSTGSPGRQIVCYTSTQDTAKIETAICHCTVLVQQNYNPEKLDLSGFKSLQNAAKEANPDLKVVLSINDKHNLLKSLDTRREAMENMINILKEVDGVELNVTGIDKDQLVSFVKRLMDDLRSKRLKKIILLALPTKPEELAKQFELKELSKYVDLFTVATHYLRDTDESYRTFHPSRLMGLFDMLNTDSLVDLISGMGAQKQKIVISAPLSAYKFTLAKVEDNTPRSPTIEEHPTVIDRKKMCDTLGKDNKNKWTIERDEDLTAPYAFANTTWISFEDDTSIKIKGKYVVLRDLAGLALRDVESDIENDCGSSLIETTRRGFTEMKRKARDVVLSSLENDLKGTELSLPSNMQSSDFRIARVVDIEGKVRAVREHTQTYFNCPRQGYFVHPRSCNRFYRCVKFNQADDDYFIFEFDCPAGLAFNEDTETCAWPGSISTRSVCHGSSEIEPAQGKFHCPGQGYFADHHNCRFFYACYDLGGPQMVPYEFRCPFGLVFDEHRLICEWPWKVPSCFGHGHGGDHKVYNFGSDNYNSGSFIPHGGIVGLGGFAGNDNLNTFETSNFGAQDVNNDDSADFNNQHDYNVAPYSTDYQFDEPIYNRQNSDRFPNNAYASQSNNNEGSKLAHQYNLMQQLPNYKPQPFQDYPELASFNNGQKFINPNDQQASFNPNDRQQFINPEPGSSNFNNGHLSKTPKPIYLPPHTTHANFNAQMPESNFDEQNLNAPQPQANYANLNNQNSQPNYDDLFAQKPQSPYVNLNAQKPENNFYNQNLNAQNSQSPYDNLNSQKPQSPYDNLNAQKPENNFYNQNLNAQNPQSSYDNLNSQKPQSPYDNINAQKPDNNLNNQKFNAQKPQFPNDNLYNQNINAPKPQFFDGDYNSRIPQLHTENFFTQTPQSGYNYYNPQIPQFDSADYNAQKPQTNYEDYNAQKPDDNFYNPNLNSQKPQSPYDYFDTQKPQPDYDDFNAQKPELDSQYYDNPSSQPDNNKEKPKPNYHYLSPQKPQSNYEDFNAEKPQDKFNNPYQTPHYSPIKNEKPNNSGLKKPESFKGQTSLPEPNIGSNSDLLNNQDTDDFDQESTSRDYDGRGVTDNYNTGPFAETEYTQSEMTENPADFADSKNDLGGPTTSDYSPTAYTGPNIYNSTYNGEAGYPASTLLPFIDQQNTLSPANNQEMTVNFGTTFNKPSTKSPNYNTKPSENDENENSPLIGSTIASSNNKISPYRGPTKRPNESSDFTKSPFNTETSQFDNNRETTGLDNFSTTLSSGYKTNEYHDNGGRGTIRYNNGVVANKIPENDIDDYRTSPYTKLPNSFIINAGNGENEQSNIMKFEEEYPEGTYTNTGFTKTGPTKTGITTAQVGGSGSYVFGTGFPRPKPNPQLIGEHAFSGHTTPSSNDVKNKPNNIDTNKHKNPIYHPTVITPNHDNEDETKTTGYSYPKPNNIDTNKHKNPIYHPTVITPNHDDEDETKTTGYSYPKPLIELEVNGVSTISGVTPTNFDDQTTPSFFSNTQPFRDQNSLLIKNDAEDSNKATLSPAGFTASQENNFYTNEHDDKSQSKTTVQPNDYTTQPRTVLDFGVSFDQEGDYGPTESDSTEITPGLKSGNIPKENAKIVYRNYQKFDVNKLQVNQNSGIIRSNQRSHEQLNDFNKRRGIQSNSQDNTFGVHVDFTQQVSSYPAANRYPIISAELTGTRPQDFSQSLSETRINRIQENKPSLHLSSKESKKGFTNNQESTKSTDLRPNQGSSFISNEGLTTKSSIDKYSNKQTSTFILRNQAQARPLIGSDVVTSIGGSVFNSEILGPNSAKRNNFRIISEFNNAQSATTASPSIRNLNKENNQKKVIVKLSDLHPLIIEKLGAECSCKADPLSSFIGSNKPNLPIDSQNRGQVNLANYDESNIYVDLDDNKENNSLKTTTAKQNDRRVMAKSQNEYVSSTPVRVQSNNQPLTTTSQPQGRIGNLDKISFRAQNRPSVRVETDGFAASLKSRNRSGKTLFIGSATNNFRNNYYEQRGSSSSLSNNEIQKDILQCVRPGLFRHPHSCNKFYACHWDEWKKRFTLHTFNCPVHLAFDTSAGACNYPSKGPACQDDKLLV